MRLRRLQLTNFRQFVEEEIEFATDPERNVTVVHGPNGSGKTTLLNAFRWVLYGDVEFENRPDALANQGAMAAADSDESVRVEVELTFEHDEQTYAARRWQLYRKRHADDLKGAILDSDIEVEITDENGVVHEPGNPETRIDKAIPERLRDLFFFDGEYIKDLAGVDNQKEIKEAIQNLMGLTIMERSIRHLGMVADEFEKEMEEYGSEELQELLERKQTLESEIDEKKRHLEDTQQTIDRIEDEINEVEFHLSQLEESAALEQQREEKREQREELEASIEDINEEIRSSITDAGYLTFAMDPIQETAEDLDRLREQGLIPSELSSEFVDSLLERERCICGRPLEEGSDHYREVASWKSEMSSEGMDQAAIRLIAHIDQFTDEREAFFEDIDEAVNRRRELQSRIDRLTEEIDDISRELESMDTDIDKDTESPAELERQRKELVARKEDAIDERGRLATQIEDLEAELEGVTDDLEEAREDQKQAQTARRRWKAAEVVQADLEDEFEELQDKVRNWSDKLVNDTFGQIASKDFQAHITEDFELKIWKEIDDNLHEVDRSRGEKQIASLAFIGSLVSIAKDRYESDPDAPYFKGGIYPIVMDSPFGALDSDHRKEVSRAMPDLAEQVVVLVTDTQWKGPVEREMSEIAGQQYWLNFDDGAGEDGHPHTSIENEQATSAQL